MKDKKTNQFKKSWKKLSQFGLIRLTHDLRYEIGITPYKWKKKRSWSSRPNNLILKDKIEKKVIFKKRTWKKRPKINYADIQKLWLGIETKIIP
jgi:hypothetical protein